MLKHPQSDGLVERFNRTLGAQVALVVALPVLPALGWALPGLGKSGGGS